MPRYRDLEPLAPGTTSNNYTANRETDGAQAVRKVTNAECPPSRVLIRCSHEWEIALRAETCRDDSPAGFRLEAAETAPIAKQDDQGPLVGGIADWPAKLGLAAIALWSCLTLYLEILVGRARLDLPTFSIALRQSGLSMLPAITAIAAIVGLILGNQIVAALSRFDLPSLILLTLSYAVIMELVPVLVGILVAGRAGVALAVRQATLVVSGEMDGLLVTGTNPIQLTLGPVLLAMLLMSFAFAVWGTLITFTAALLWIWSTAGIPPVLFLDALAKALTPAELLEALGKPMLFALVIALIATVNGTLAGRNPAGIGRAATGTMIGAVTAILLVDLVFVLLL